MFKPEDKITFSVRQILCIRSLEVVLDWIDLSSLPVVTDLLDAPEIISGGGFRDVSADEPDYPALPVMCPDIVGVRKIADGIYLTGAGLVDGQLHVQLRYDDFLETGTHGRLFLIGTDGEKTEDRYMSVHFLYDSADACFQEYVFPVPIEALQNCGILGEFETGEGGLIEGPWQVTIPPVVN